MNKHFLPAVASAAVLVTSTMSSCVQSDKTESDKFEYVVDRFADVEILRYQVPGFEELTLNQKQLIYWLNEAALAGRDMLWDQNCRYNLQIRDLIEAVYLDRGGMKDEVQHEALELYLKQLWMGNGIHHHYSMDKFAPGFSREFLEARVNALPADKKPENAAELIDVIFDRNLEAKRVNQAEGADLVATSAANIYAPGLTQKEVEEYYNSIKVPGDTMPVSYGLNSRKVRGADGKVCEDVYSSKGLYAPAIKRIVENLEKASEFAENENQKAVIAKLIEYFNTGDLKAWDDYSILWLGETEGQVDFINGFIESYGDPLGLTGAYESIVNFKNNEASHRTEVLSADAQWFEDHSPIDPRFRKDEVKGVSAKVITAAILAGDSYPATPIGINLPNADWIRALHGSKSVTIENITAAYDAASHGNGFNEEFVIDEPTRELMDKYLFITDNMHTDLHECLGHGSGQLLPGVEADALKAHGSTLEETRADLFALYYLADPHLIELGLLDDPEAYKAEYYKYLLNGLMTQLVRIEPGKDIEEAHMRNRQLISQWVLEHGEPHNVLGLVKKDGKTYLEVNDYDALRQLFGKLLGEIQRIKSEGDYASGAALVEKYGVKVDPALHSEVLDRYSKLDIAPYRGFVNPVYSLVTDNDGNVTDVKVDYTENYVDQNLRYSREYSMPALR
ncbi:MAG: dipeptidyl peptidase 3 [Muribaculaceae bacterium]|nr:dipeptidyl peptidase 3 [Muribaculaceae bacterium]MDE6610787.1 dipeptidyl peptidase 3 [Muribaculaceae bacterium]